MIEKNNNRAIRRHHKDRMKAKAKRKYKNHPRAIYYCDHMTICSCPVCGNPRKHFGQKTRQEIKNCLDSF